MSSDNEEQSNDIVEVVGMKLTDFCYLNFTLLFIGYNSGIYDEDDGKENSQKIHASMLNKSERYSTIKQFNSNFKC